MSESNSQFKIGTITHLTSYSTLIYFGSLIVGELVDLTLISIGILPQTIAFLFGIVLMSLGTGLIVWTYNCGKKYSQNRQTTKVSTEDLSHGPYRFSRNPHHLGIGVLLIGIALFVNSLALLGSTIIGFLLVNFIFLAKEEKILKDRHGDLYDEYKSKTHKWL